MLVCTYFIMLKLFFMVWECYGPASNAFIVLYMQSEIWRYDFIMLKLFFMVWECYGPASNAFIVLYMQSDAWDMTIWLLRKPLLLYAIRRLYTIALNSIKKAILKNNTCTLKCVPFIVISVKWIEISFI